MLVESPSGEQFPIHDPHLISILNRNLGEGFTENEFVGHKLQIGSTAVLEVIERDKRCKIITLDPETADADPELMRQVVREHDGTAGVYAAVLVEGMVRRGDELTLPI